LSRGLRDAPVGLDEGGVGCVIAVDLFAGAGGWTEGATRAGVHVAAAVNHWPIAVRSHALNHPATEHRCQDVSLLDPRDLPAHDILLASPACQGHSKARGKERPHHDASRSTAWAVVDVAEVTRPRVLLVENVPDFRRWVLYPLWREALRRLGYDVTENLLNAADFGVPQERVRLFLVGLRGKAAPAVRAPAGRKVAASEILDLAAGPWAPVNQAGRAMATLARIAAGRAAFGRRFLMPYYKSGSGLTGRSLARPIGTITTKDRWAIVDGDRMRMLVVDECRRAMAFRGDYRLLGTRADQMKQLGNAVCPPVAEEVVRQTLEAAA
jgi:DNA (cytosine-5)-methyltransferase 1